MLLWACKGQGSRPAIPVAIVNNDKPVTTGSGKDQKTIAAGRELAADLNEPTPPNTTPLSWELLDAADAAEGLRHGGYYAVLTIPEGFSAAINSTSGNDPKSAELPVGQQRRIEFGGGRARPAGRRPSRATLGDQVTSCTPTSCCRA